jgi:hypothetical protein
MNPRFPIYIPSKSRADSRLTMRSLDAMGVPYHVVVEPQQLEEYAAVIDRSKLLVLDMSYKDKFDACMKLEPGQSTGSGPTRNFIWDHAASLGVEYYWTMDDNIRGFYRANRNRQILMGDGLGLRCMEDFVLRYTNVVMAGPNYYMFAPRKIAFPPFVMNTRIYSCNLIRTAAPYRWRGRYNEDTDLSLRMLKDGWCTIQFNAFLQQKISTQLMKGGNTEAFYAEEGTLAKSQMIVDLHPDVARLVKRFRRWHHYVDYHPFAKNRLIRKPGLVIPEGVNDYGMKIVEVG